MKTAQQLMGRLQTSFDAQELLVDGQGGVGGDLLAICPPRLAISLDGSSDRLRVAREEVCQNKKEAKERIRSRPDLQSAAQRKKAKKLTVDDVFDLMEAEG